MEKIDWQQIRSIDLVDYLSQLGKEPASIKGNEYWYYSPFREERTPSFKVDRRKNVWYDWGEGKGGNLIDFAVHYHKCTIREFLESIKGNLNLTKPWQMPQQLQEEKDKSIRIVGERKLWSYPLLDYLKQRNIPIAIADKYCREVSYTLQGKQYYGIGFKNDMGGFEIRNAHFKAASAPKSFTTIKNGAQDICVFEGFFDFLSFKTLHQHLPDNSYDFMVLNSLSFFEKARPVVEQYNNRLLYLDQNAPGRKVTLIALSLSEQYKDESKLYSNYDDLNDFHCNFGIKQPKADLTKHQKTAKPHKGL